MDGLPVTVRLLDPPLHEFLPDHEELIVKQAKGELTGAEEKLLHASELWRESNPMLGTRGCRLGIIKPGLYRMQVRALMQAAVTRKQAGGNPIVEIMIPLIVSEPELALLEQWTREEADLVAARRRTSSLPYLVGTMIETPRAALVADGIADVAEFFSFGTNDLTQMTFGFSRDDIEGRFMSEYLEYKLLPANPFETLDVEGVGQLVRMGCEKGRARASGHQARHLRRARRRPARRSRSATRSASTTCRARRTACRSPVSRPPTPRSAPAAPAPPPDSPFGPLPAEAR